MAKYILLIIIAITANLSFAQTKVKQNPKVTPKDTSIIHYKIFPTQNIWTFIKLNTRNGQMWQMHFGMENNNRFVTELSTDTLVSVDKEVNERFTLYPTQNIYTFILLDQIDGRTWQVQWSKDPKERGIMPIE